MEKIESYRKKLKIDRNDLDNELMRQPVLFERVAHQCALAISRRDQDRDAQKAVDARLNSMIREMTKPEGQRITEAYIGIEVEKHEDHKNARRDYKISCLEADEWFALKEAFMQRGYVLKDLVQLWISSYYSESSTTSEDGTRVRKDELARQARKARKERSK